MDPILLALRNRRKTVAPPPRRPTVPGRPAASPGASAPAPPNFADLLAELSRGPVERSDAEWAALLDPRMKPYTDMIEGSTARARGFNEYNYETKAATNQGLSSAFASMVTGGQPGDAGMAYSKENFGGSYMGAQVMSMASQRLSELTGDFDESDWKITSDYLAAMQEIPSIREELRATLEKADLDEHARKVTQATLLADETWRYYNENRRMFENEQTIKREKGESARDFKERKRQFDEQMNLARGELGADIIDDAADNATAATNAAIRAAQLELSQAREARQGLKDQAQIKQANTRIKISQENLKLQRQKFQQSKKPGGASDAQKAETDLAIDILQDRDAILGKPKTSGLGKGKRVGGMTYLEAYDYIRGLADAQMSAYRKPAYIDSWVKRQLRAMGFGGASAAKPRGG